MNSSVCQICYIKDYTPYKMKKMKVYKNKTGVRSPTVVQWLEFGTFIALGLGLIPRREVGISEAARLSPKTDWIQQPTIQMGEGALMLFISNDKSTKKLWLQTGKPSHFDQWNLKLLGKENVNSVPRGMRWLIYNTSTFTTTLKFVNSWGVHCFFLHFHLPSFILQKNKKVTSKSQERAV